MLNFITKFSFNQLFIYSLVLFTLFYLTVSINDQNNDLLLPDSSSLSTSLVSSTSSLPSDHSLSSSSQELTSTVSQPRRLACVAMNVTSPYKYQIFPTGFNQVIRWQVSCYSPDDLIDIELYYHDTDLNMDAYVSTVVTGWNASLGFFIYAVPAAVPIAGVDSFQFKLNFYVSPGGHSNRAIGKTPIFIISKYIPPRYPYAETAGIVLGALTLFSCIICFFGWRCCRPGCCYYPLYSKLRDYIKKKLAERRQRKLAAKMKIQAEIERKRHEALLAEAAKLSFGLWGTPAYSEPRLPPKRMVYPPIQQENDVEDDDKIIIGFTEDGQPKFGYNPNKKRNKRHNKRGRGNGRNHRNNGRDYIQANNGSSDEEPLPRTEAEAQAKAARQRIEAARRLSANGYPSLSDSDENNNGTTNIDIQPTIMIDDQGGNNHLGQGEETELISTSTFHNSNNNNNTVPVVDSRPINSYSAPRTNSGNRTSTAGNSDLSWANSGPNRDIKPTSIQSKALPPLGSAGYYDSDSTNNSRRKISYDGNGGDGYHSNYDNLSQPSIDDELSSVGGRAMHLEYTPNNDQPISSQNNKLKLPSYSSSSSTQGDSLDEHTQQYSYGSRKPSAGYYNNVSSSNIVNNNTLNTSNRGIMLSPGSASNNRNNSANNILSGGRPPRSRPIPGPSDDFVRTALGPYDNDDYTNNISNNRMIGYQSDGSLHSFDDNEAIPGSTIGVIDNMNYSSNSSSGRSSANNRRTNYGNNTNNVGYSSSSNINNDNRYYSSEHDSEGGNDSTGSGPRPAFVRVQSGNSLPKPRAGLDTLHSGNTAGDAFVINSPNNNLSMRPASGSYLPSPSGSNINYSLNASSERVGSGNLRSPPGTSGRSMAGKTGAAVIYS